MLEISTPDNLNLLDIFVDDNDKKSMDLLSISDTFNVMTERLGCEITKDTRWDVYEKIEGFTGEIAVALKSGYDISQAGLLVADHSHFSKEIIDGLRKGIYHIGQSKEVAGNLRPAILDDKEQLVKFFTLKKAFNPTGVLSDISTLSMQIALQNISIQIEDIRKDLEYLTGFERNKSLNVPFLNAREKIMLASNSSEEEDRFLEEAETYLMEGTNNIYSDIYKLAEQLAPSKRPKIKLVNSTLEYFNEDMQILPKYIGMRVYLFNYRGESDQAKRVFEQYQYQLQCWSRNKSIDNKYSVFELIHEYYPYKANNRDFWLEKPEEVIRAFDAYDSMLDQKNIFYITAEESGDE